MIRRLYVWLLHLHPEAFRQRYGEEMLEIFDHERRRGRTLFLLADAAFSAGRQRLLRPEDSDSPAAARGAPLFATGTAGGPRVAVLAPAALISLAAFAGLHHTVVRYGGPSGLLRLPTVLVPSSNAPLKADRARTAPAVPAEAARPGPRSVESAGARRPWRPSGHETLITVFAGLDVDGDGVIRAAERRRADAGLAPLLACADLDGDGEIRWVDFLRAVKRGASGCPAVDD